MTTSQQWEAGLPVPTGGTWAGLAKTATGNGLARCPHRHPSFGTAEQCGRDMAAHLNAGYPVVTAPTEAGRSDLARMHDAARDDFETETLTALSLRAGLIWECRATGTEDEPLDPCYTKNDEDAARCYACGAPKPERAPRAGDPQAPPYAGDLPVSGGYR